MSSVSFPQVRACRRRRVLALAALLLLGQGRLVAAEPEDKPFDVTPAANVDQRLFLVCVLGDTYDRWPAPGNTPEYIQRRLEGTRQELTRLHAHIRDARLDDDLAGLFKDGINLTESYEQFLVNLGVIRRGITARSQKEDFATGFKAGSNLVGDYNRLREDGYSDKEAAGISALGNGLQLIWDNYQNQKRRDQDKQEATAGEMRKVRNASEAARARAEAVVRRLTERYRWRAGEAGFDGFRTKKMGELMARRPRDPFLIVANALIRVKGETPANVLNDARACLAAARLVPAGKVYDDYRLAFLVTAGDLATDAAGREVKNYGNAPVDSGKEAVRMWRTVFAGPVDDADDQLKAQLARALGAAGRLQDALDTARAATGQHSNPFFAYRTARLCSLLGRTDEALDWFTKAIDGGFDDIAFARKDPDLSKLRDQHDTKFAGLVRVSAAWEVKFGWLNDDIVLTNRSRFPLRNVVLDVRLEQDGRVWTRQLNASWIRPGQTYKWEDVVSIPGSRLTSKSATLTCDENR